MLYIRQPGLYHPGLAPGTAAHAPGRKLDAQAGRAAWRRLQARQPDRLPLHLLPGRRPGAAPIRRVGRQERPLAHRAAPHPARLRRPGACLLPLPAPGRAQPAGPPDHAPARPPLPGRRAGVRRAVRRARPARAADQAHPHPRSAPPLARPAAISPQHQAGAQARLAAPPPIPPPLPPAYSPARPALHLLHGRPAVRNQRLGTPPPGRPPAHRQPPRPPAASGAAA